MIRKPPIYLLVFFFCYFLTSEQSEAALSTFKSYSGPIGYSTDGFGENNGVFPVTNWGDGTISASVPAGSTIVSAYLYQSTQGGPACSASASTATLDGNSVTFGAPVFNTGITPGGDFSAVKRADVTSIVAAKINGGAGGTYDFTIVETGDTGAGCSGSNDDNVDGEALVVVYSNPSLSTNSILISDGFSPPSGSTTTLTFSSPLHPADPGFAAEIILGIGYSCCGQDSRITVNGTIITNEAGNFDDDATTVANGALITVGGFNDTLSDFLPTYGCNTDPHKPDSCSGSDSSAIDHERYNVVPRITDGDTSITISTLNPSVDDNIFLLVFSGTGQIPGAELIEEVEEPPVVEEEIVLTGCSEEITAGAALGSCIE